MCIRDSAHRVAIVDDAQGLGLVVEGECAAALALCAADVDGRLALAELLPMMPARGQPEQVLTGTRFNPAHLLPKSTAHYRYDGSLTAPPCTEGVLWLVMKQPLTLSAAQLAQLKALFPPNARPVQPLHGRVVSEGA